MPYKKPTDRAKIVDPRQVNFKAFYTDPKSDTFCNALQSAIRAGYSELYANNITAQQPNWFTSMLESADVQRAEMLAKAEKNLRSVVDEPKPEDKDMKKLWTQTSQYLSGTLGKDHYSTRSELTGADGRRLFTNDTRDAAKMPLATLFKGVAKPE